MSRARRIIQRAVPVVVSIGALAVLLDTADPDKLVEALSWKVALVMLPALLAYGAVTLVIESWSILRLIAPVPSGFEAWTAARIKCASYLLAIVNYGLGVAALTVLLRRRADIGLAKSASVVLLISSADLVVVLGMAAVGAAIADTGQATVRAGVLAAAGIGFFGGLALLRAPASLGPLEKIRSLALFEALRTLPLGRLAELLTIRAVFSVCFIGVAGMAFVAFDLPLPPLGKLVAGMMIIAIVGALPIAVAGLGTVNWAFREIFGDGANDDALLAMSLVLQFGMVSLRAGMGLVFAREFTREALEEARREEA